MKRIALILSIALMFLVVSPYASAIMVDPDDPAAPQVDDESAGDPDRLVDILYEWADLETGLLYITFITASGEHVTIAFGTRQVDPDPYPAPVPYYAGEPTDEPAPWSSVCVDDEGAGVCGC